MRDWDLLQLLFPFLPSLFVNCQGFEYKGLDVMLQLCKLCLAYISSAHPISGRISFGEGAEDVLPECCLD